MVAFEIALEKIISNVYRKALKRVPNNSKKAASMKIEVRKDYASIKQINKNVG